MATDKILVVDDERLVRWSLRQKCEEWGYQVIEAEAGEPGLKLAQFTHAISKGFAKKNSNSASTESMIPGNMTSRRDGAGCNVHEPNRQD